VSPSPNEIRNDRGSGTQETGTPVNTRRSIAADSKIDRRELKSQNYRYELGLIATPDEKFDARAHAGGACHSEASAITLSRTRKTSRVLAKGKNRNTSPFRL
jgi:hypothetical protein